MKYPSTQGIQIITRRTACLIAILFSICSAFAGQKIEKVIFIGDSITQHAPNIAKLDWSGNYGMAASAEDKDYVHLFMAKLAEQQGREPELSVYAKGGGTLAGQLKFLDDFASANADIAVVQMGENDKLHDHGVGFRRDYGRILEALRKGNPKAQIFCFGVWSPTRGNTEKDAIIQQLCEKYDADFVSLSAANADPANQAGTEGRFTNKGVNWHPGDKGMQAMADALWSAYTNEEVESSATGDGRVAWSIKEDWSASSTNDWHPISPAQGGKAHVKQKTPNKSSMYHLDLPVDEIKGGYLTVKTRVKAEDVSEKPNNWNGIKIMLRVENAEGVMDYPQYHLPVGSFDWTDIDWNVYIPDNTVSLRLSIGLENVTGEIYVDTVELFRSHK